MKGFGNKVPEARGTRLAAPVRSWSWFSAEGGIVCRRTDTMHSGTGTLASRSKPVTGMAEILPARVRRGSAGDDLRARTCIAIDAGMNEEPVAMLTGRTTAEAWREPKAIPGAGLPAQRIGRGRSGGGVGEGVAARLPMPDRFRRHHLSRGSSRAGGTPGLSGPARNSGRPCCAPRPCSASAGGNPKVAEFG